MPKNRTTMNQELFLRALEVLDYLKPSLRDALSGARYIRLADDEEGVKRERLYLGSLAVVRSYQDAAIYWMSVDSRDGARLIFMGPSLDISAPLDIRQATASEFLFFSDFFEIYPNKDASSLIEVLGSGSGEDADYKGHDYQQIATLYDRLYVVEGIDCRTSCISSVLSRHHITLNYMYGRNFQAPIFKKILESQWTSCEFEQAKLQLLSQIGGPLFFMILYWIVEGFFFGFAARDFYIATDSALSEEDFYENMESRLDWRPKEIVAFQKLLSHILDSDSLRDLCEAASDERTLATIDVNSRSDFLAKKLYSFRNSLVHSRHKKRPASLEDLSKYACIMFDVVDRLFAEKHPHGQTECKCGMSLYYAHKNRTF